MPDPDYTTPRPLLVVLKIDRILDVLFRSNVNPPLGIVLSREDYHNFRIEMEPYLPTNVQDPNKVSNLKYRGVFIQEAPPTMEDKTHAHDRLQGPT